MKLTGYPREWNDDEGILPIEVQDLQIQGTPEELRKLSSLLSSSADKYESGSNENYSDTFGNSRPNPQTGIMIQVLHNDDAL